MWPRPVPGGGGSGSSVLSGALLVDILFGVASSCECALVEEPELSSRLMATSGGGGGGFLRVKTPHKNETA